MVRLKTTFRDKASPSPPKIICNRFVHARSDVIDENKGFGIPTVHEKVAATEPEHDKHPTWLQAFPHEKGKALCC